MAAGTEFKKQNMYPRPENGRVLKKMLSVDSVTKMLTKEKKYSDKGSTWIYQLRYHSRIGNVKINDNTLVK